MGSDKFKGKLGAKRPVPVGSFMMRRVFRQDNRFYCGICRTFHATVEDANDCLESCWRSVLNRAPWTQVKKVGQTGFACIYCQRIYSTTDLASACADECSARMTITSLDGRDLSPNRKKHTFIKHNIKPTVNFPFKIGGKKDQDSDAAQASTTAPSTTNETPEVAANPAAAAPMPPPAAPAPAAAAAPEEKAAKQPVDRTKKFERVGSKYECVICHKKYFERVEVEKCFDAHSGGSMDAHQNSGV